MTPEWNMQTQVAATGIYYTYRSGDGSALLPIAVL